MMSNKSTSKAVSLIEETSSSKPKLVDGSKVNCKEDLVELAEQIALCDASIKSAASSKLRSILDQMRSLQQQAARVLEESKRDAELHHAACNFKKLPGKIYYLYRRPNDSTYLSMLGPEEWGASCPHTFLAAYKLEFDMTWTPYEDIEKNEADNQLVEKLVKKQFQMAIMNE